MELVLLYLVLGGVGLFGVTQTFDSYQHSKTLQADKYSQCVKYAESVRECRKLED